MHWGIARSGEMFHPSCDKCPTSERSTHHLDKRGVRRLRANEVQFGNTLFSSEVVGPSCCLLQITMQVSSTKVNLSAVVIAGSGSTRSSAAASSGSARSGWLYKYSLGTR